MHKLGRTEAQTPAAQANPAPGLVGLPVRLHPGDDLRLALEHVITRQGVEAGFVVAGIGSLRPALIRLAAAQEPLRLDEDVELLSLSGSLCPTGSHLHLCVSLRDGRVLGGHAAYGCVVRTTAEVLLAPLPAWRFCREHDIRTGYEELVIRKATV